MRKQAEKPTQRANLFKKMEGMKAGRKEGRRKREEGKGKGW